MYTYICKQNSKQMKQVATKVLSVRIPAPVHSEIKTFCSHKGITVSEYVSRSFTDIGQTKLFNVDKDVKIDNDLAKTLTTIGGASMIGILSYKAVNRVVTDKYPGMTKSEVELVSTVSGIAVAMAAGFGIAKLISLLASVE